MAEQPAVGTRARFFHPRTLGVMLPGRVVKLHDDGSVSVRFEVDGKVWRTHPDRIAEGR
jgi:hypothetical protein